MQLTCLRTVECMNMVIIMMISDIQSIVLGRKAINEHKNIILTLRKNSTFLKGEKLIIDDKLVVLTIILQVFFIIRAWNV